MKAAEAIAPLALGAAIPGHPGFLYAGLVRGEDDASDYALGVHVGQTLSLRGPWGEYGKRIEGASHRRDGLANTQAMANAGSAIAKAALDAGFYIASLGEAQLIAANLHDLMPKGCYWTSTQYSPRDAWVQGFEYGLSRIDRKINELRAVAVRRFNPSDFDPSTGAA